MLFNFSAIQTLAYQTTPLGLQSTNITQDYRRWNGACDNSTISSVPTNSDDDDDERLDSVSSRTVSDEMMCALRCSMFVCAYSIPIFVRRRRRRSWCQPDWRQLSPHSATVCAKHARASSHHHDILRLPSDGDVAVHAEIAERASVDLFWFDCVGVVWQWCWHACSPQGFMDFSVTHAVRMFMRKHTKQS